MQRITNIYRLGVKELRCLWHDKVLLLLVIWAFSGGIYSVATGTSLELHNAAIAIVDEDRSALSARIITAFYGPYFRPPALITATAADTVLDSGRFTFVLDIPPNFERDVLAGRQPEIQVIVDATRMSQAFIGSGYIENILNGEISEFTRGFRTDTQLPVQLGVRVKFNPNLNSTWFGAVMELINNVTMLGIILTGAALLREREHGTIEHLLVMPLTPFDIMSAKVWANGLVVLSAAALSLLLVVQALLQVPVAGAVSLFLAGAALHLFAATSMGIFFGTLARSMPQLGLMMILVILPLQMLSGGSTPYESMPQIVQIIMQAAPTTHFVSIAQAILYRGAGWAVVWPHFAAVGAIGGVFFFIALLRFRKSIAQSQ